MLHVTGLCDKL